MPETCAFPSSPSFAHVPTSRALALASAAASFILSACASVPDLGPTARPKAATAYETQRSFTAPSSAWPSDQWWTTFQDPQLTALMNEAFAGSPNLAQAEARIRRAAAQAMLADAALAPRVSLNANGAYARLSEIAGMPTSGEFESFGRATLDFSYEFDFWGRNRAALATATSEYRAAEASAAAARLALAAALAGAYAEFSGLIARQQVASDAVRIRSETYDLVSQRVENGLDTRAELRQSEARLAAARADVTAIEEAVLVTRYRIAALLGAGPDRGLIIEAPELNHLRGFGLPPALGTELVARRPDVVAARWRAEAAAARIGVARARFYPNINILAFVGTQVLGLDRLFGSGSEIASLGPAFSLPIFDGGRLAASYRGARAEYDEAVAVYDTALTQAFQDVADAAARIRALQEQLRDIRSAADAAEDAYQLARLRFEGGLAPYQAVLLAEDALVALRRVETDLRTRGLVLDIALVRALGGGFEASPHLDQEAGYVR